MQNKILLNFLFRLFYCYIVLINISVYGQNIKDEELITKGLVFDNVYSNEGLPDNRIRSIFQSKSGYLWIGTHNGLTKYDGYTFSNYSKKHDSKGISGNWVYDITEDALGNIWIATTEGVSKLISSQDTIVNYTSSKHLTHKEVRTLYVDDSQRVWIGTKNGLSIYNTKTDAVLKFDTKPFNNTINSIIKDRKGHIWLSCETGLVCFNSKDLSHTYFPLEIKSNPYGDKIWDLFSLNNDIWMGTGGNGLFRFNIDSVDAFGNRGISKLAPEKVSHNIEVFDLKEGPLGSLWLATGKGLGRLSFSEGETTIEFFKHDNNNKYSISNDLLYRLCFDASKNLWIGSDMGLNILLFNNLNFKNYAFRVNLNEDAIRGITGNDKNNIILATNSNGVFKMDAKKPIIDEILINNSTNRIKHCRSITSLGQTIFVGTLDGLVIKSLKTGKQSHILKGKNIFSLVNDSIASKIYIGAIDGLYVYDINKSKLIPENKIIGGFARSLSFAKDGSLWVGVDGPKIYLKKPAKNTFEEIHLPTEFRGFEINGIEHDNYGNSWIGTQSGLNKISKDSKGAYICEHFNESDGLIDKMVNGLLVDENNNLWLSTIKGITKFDIVKKRFEYFLPNLIFKPSSFYKQNEYSFLFGHEEGFIEFNPCQFTINQEPSNIQFTSLFILNKKISAGQVVNGDVIIKSTIEEMTDIILNHKNNIFTLEYANLNGSFDKNSRYEYKLEGFDKNWIYNKRGQHSATYTNLDPGSYVFMVKTINQEGLEQIKELRVKILSPPWKSWWAILFYILSLLGIIFIFIRFSIENDKNENLLVLEKKEKEQIKHLNDQKLQFFTNISHEFRTPVTLIAGPIRDIVNDSSISVELRNKAKIIEKNGDKLTYLIDELLTFRELGKGYVKLKPKPFDILKFIEETVSNFQIFAESKEVLISCHSTLDDNLIMADPAQFYKVVNNLVTNALKFCPSNSVIRIGISRLTKKQLTKNQLAIDSRWISLEIIDQGDGISEQHIQHIFDRFYKVDTVYAGTGIGLAITKEIVELHKGSIQVDSKPKNNRFIVMLPKGKPENADVPVLQNSEIYHKKLKPESLLLPETVDLEDSYKKTFGDFDKKKILLVDDNSELLDYLRMLLKTNYHINLALNGEEALEIIKKEKPDLIVSDVMMPKMGGIELCEYLKRNSETMYIPIILLSAKTTAEAKIEGISAGADDYLEKPFHSEVLKTKIYKLIESRGELVKNFQNKQIKALENISRNPIDEDFIQKTIDYIHENMENDEFSVEELSDKMAMSRSNLFRRVKQITEMSPVSFIYYLRLQKALELIVERKLSVSEIAWKVGYKNPASFSKSFKKQYGKSPTDYLNSLIKNN